MRERAWKIYLLAISVLIAGMFFVPDGSWVQVGWQVGVGYIATGAIVWGVLRHKPRMPVVWWLFAAGVFGNASGALVEAINGKILHIEAFPSSADYFYLSLYPFVAFGLALLIRRRTERQDWGALVDATTVTTGLGLLAWVFMIHPAASDTSIGLLGHIFSIAYPVGDVVLVAMTVRLQLGGGTRTPSYYLMSGSLLLFLAGDTAWAVVNQVGWEPPFTVRTVLYINFLFAYALFGAAALHPTVREVSRTGQAQPPRLSPALLGLLTAASARAISSSEVSAPSHTARPPENVWPSGVTPRSRSMISAASSTSAPGSSTMNSSPP